MTRGACPFIWYDQMSNDLKGSEAFYAAAIGWTIGVNTMNAQPYTLLRAGDVMVGGLMPIPDDSKAKGVRPGWMGYIGVPDVDAYAKTIIAAGGAVFRPPTDIPNVGRFAVCGDPHGAGFIIMKGNGAGAPLNDPAKPGHIAWRELYAGDVAADFAFYADLFGWEKGRTLDIGPMGTYQYFAIDGRTVGGMMTKPAQLPAPQWTYYVTVESVDDAIARVKAGGGRVFNGPTQVPDGRWVAQAADPQGALFGLSAAAR